MSLFGNLLQLNPTNVPMEDFFTEMFAHLLQSDYFLFSSWLKHFNISDLEPSDVVVRTQESYDALEGHSSSSRPDVYIKFSTSKGDYLIFVECKIDAVEGPDQLKRYAEHLDNLSNIPNRVLIYVTRDYDKKDINHIFSECSDDGMMKFVQMRWYQTYQFLHTYHENHGNELLSEILKFMEEYNLSGNNRFSTVDILAMSNFPRVRKIMDETMGGIVSDKFKEVAQKIPYASTCFTQLKAHNRYVFAQGFGTPNFNILLGYWLDSSKITSYPTVGVVIEAGPSVLLKDEIINSFAKISKPNSNWVSFDLDKSNAWFSIKQETSLDKFLNEEDHITAIQNYFVSLLGEVQEIKEKYPQLPWE